MRYLYKLVSYLKENRAVSFFVIFFSSFFFYLYHNEYDLLKSIYDAMALFALDIREPVKKSEFWYLIYFLSLFAALYTVLTVIELFILKWLKDGLKRSILKRKNHIVVVGLNDTTKVYIDSEIRDNTKDIIVIQKDEDNPYISLYDKDIAVVVFDASDKKLYEELCLKDAKHIVICSGSDMDNIETALNMLSYDKDLKLYINIEDKNLREFHKSGGLLSQNNVEIFSYSKEGARELFEKIDIDFKDDEFIQSDNSYAIALMGESNLTFEIIKNIAILGQLPKENLLKLKIVSSDIKRFKNRLYMNFPKIDEVPNLKVEFIELFCDSYDFYKDALWKEKFAHIIVSYDDDKKNLQIASNLINHTFLDEIVDKSFDTTISISMFDGYFLSDEINSNKTLLKPLNIFGRKYDIFDKKYIISGERDKEAVAVNLIYSTVGFRLKDSKSYLYEYDEKDFSEFHSFISVDDKRWKSLSYIEKESNRYVADHLKVKLKYLGLIALQSDEDDLQKLYSYNKDIFFIHYKDRYILAKNEHNRWMAFYILNGYSKTEFIPKVKKQNLKKFFELKKEHMCLVEFDEFKSKKEELNKLGYKEGEFEGYDFMINDHIPHILSSAGFILKKRVKVGVTGHRELKDIKRVKELLNDVISRIKKSFFVTEFISPLAEGADTLVAKEFVNQLGCEVKVLLPYEKEFYMQTFSKEHKEEFVSLVLKAREVDELCSLTECTKEDAYQKVGERVVEESDILIAVWDSKDARGKGGTADIVKYAKSLQKPIIHIDTTSYKIKFLNTKGTIYEKL